MGKTKRSPAFPKRQQAKVSVEDSQKDLPIKKRLISQIVRDILLFLHIECKEISIYFVTKKEISDLHAQFFQDPTPTDCISFPLDQDHLGEVFVCPRVAIEYAKEKGLDPFEETILYVIHGILHLIGYDDLEPSEKKQMRCMEKKCMNHVKEYLCS